MRTPSTVLLYQKGPGIAICYHQRFLVDALALSKGEEGTNDEEALRSGANQSAEGGGFSKEEKCIVV